MRIVVDTNIVFSAILNTNSRIAHILLQPKSGFSFYSTKTLILEIEEHRLKLIQISGYSEAQFNRAYAIISRKIRFIDQRLIPNSVYKNSLSLTEDTDIDDTEFVALADHVKGWLWSGDKKLIRGLIAKGWNKSISTAELWKQMRSKTK